MDNNLYEFVKKMLGFLLGLFIVASSLWHKARLRPNRQLKEQQNLHAPESKRAKAKAKKKPQVQRKKDEKKVTMLEDGQADGEANVEETAIEDEVVKQEFRFKVLAKDQRSPCTPTQLRRARRRKQKDRKLVDALAVQFFVMTERGVEDEQKHLNSSYTTGAKSKARPVWSSPEAQDLTTAKQGPMEKSWRSTQHATAESDCKYGHEPKSFPGSEHSPLSAASSAAPVTPIPAQHATYHARVELVMQLEELSDVGKHTITEYAKREREESIGNLFLDLIHDSEASPEALDEQEQEKPYSDSDTDLDLIEVNLKQDLGTAKLSASPDGKTMEARVVRSISPTATKLVNIKPIRGRSRKDTMMLPALPLHSSLAKETWLRSFPVPASMPRSDSLASDQVTQVSSPAAEVSVHDDAPVSPTRPIELSWANDVIEAEAQKAPARSIAQASLLERAADDEQYYGTRLKLTLRGRRSDGASPQLSSEVRKALDGSVRRVQNPEEYTAHVEEIQSDHEDDDPMLRSRIKRVVSEPILGSSRGRRYVGCYLNKSTA